MPYVIQNENIWNFLTYSKWYPIASVNRLVYNLITVDCSVEGGRRAARQQLEQFMTEGIYGDVLFNENTRFPDERVFISTYDITFQRTLVSLSTTLSQAKRLDKITNTLANISNFRIFSRIDFENMGCLYWKEAQDIEITPKQNTNKPIEDQRIQQLQQQVDSLQATVQNIIAKQTDQGSQEFLNQCQQQQGDS